MENAVGPELAGVSLRELSRLALPAGSAVRAGRGLLDRPIKWAGWLTHTTTGWQGVGPGDCALVDPATVDLEAAIAAAIEIGVAAICSTQRPRPATIARCEESAVALIELPRGASLRAAERAIVSLIVNRQAELDQRGIRLYRQLAELVAADKGIGAIVVALHELTGRIAILETATGGLRFHAGPLPPELQRDALDNALGQAPPSLPEDVRCRATSTAPPVVRRDLSSIGLDAYTAPVLVGEAIAGWLSVAGPPGALTDLDQVAAGRAAAVSALELAKQRAVSVASSRASGDFFADLLTGSFVTEEAAERLARTNGYELRLPATVLVWRPRAATGETHRLVGELQRVVEEGLGHLGDRHFVRATADRVIALFSSQGNVEAARIWSQRARARLSFADQIAVGIGRPAERIRDIQRSYEEAEQALDLAMLGGHVDPVIAFADLGVYRLLMPLRQDPTLQHYFVDTLGSLFDYERRRGARLVPTLRAFLNQNGNVSRTAEVLGVHRNTLFQRLERIEALTGYDLSDPEARLSLHLGLKIATLLDR